MPKRISIEPHLSLTELEQRCRQAKDAADENQPNRLAFFYTVFMSLFAAAKRVFRWENIDCPKTDSTRITMLMYHELQNNNRVISLLAHLA
jgi:hypothetical protein